MNAQQAIIGLFAGKTFRVFTEVYTWTNTCLQQIATMSSRHEDGDNCPKEVAAKLETYCTKKGEVLEHLRKDYVDSHLPSTRAVAKHKLWDTTMGNTWAHYNAGCESFVW